MSHDFYVDTFDTIDGIHVVYSSKSPERTYEVCSLLDYCGEHTDDPEEAAGGVIKFADECFVVFMWSTA